MKIRMGFITNSSSNNFLIISKEELTFGDKSAMLFERKEGYHAYWGYTSSDDSPITQFFTTDSFEIEDKDFYLNGRACVW